MPFRVCRTAVLLCLLLASTASFAAAAEFSDVPQTFWAWPYIQGVSGAGIASGFPNGTYQPDAAVTRDQMAVYVARALAEGDAKVPTGPDTASFSDVGLDHWAFKYIEYVKLVDITTGYPDGSYQPGGEVSRGQMAVYISRAIATPTGEAGLVDYTPPAAATFSDVPTTHWAYKYVEYAKSKSIVSGYPDGSYHPDEVVNRAQMAVYVCRAFALEVPAARYDVGDYFPIAEGDTRCFDENDGPCVRTVAGTVTLGGKAYSQFADNDGHTVYWRLDDEGLHFGGFVDPRPEGDQTTTFDSPFLFPRVVAVGDTGTLTTQVFVNGSPAGEGTFTYTLIGAESVTVKAGTFPNCLKLEIQMTVPGADPEHFLLWLAPGIGEVKSDSRPFGGVLWTELVAASIGGVIIPAQSYKIADYCPLNQGDTWDYTRDGQGWRDSPTLTVSGTTTLGGQVYSNLTEAAGGQDTEYWRVGADGLYLGGVYNQQDNTKFVGTPPIFFPNSLVPGGSVSGTSTVTVNGANPTAMPYRVSFLGIETALVPAGMFPYCMKIEFAKTPPGSGGEEVSTYWLASGVGTVKRVDVYPGEDTETWQLTSATVGGVHYPQ